LQVKIIGRGKNKGEDLFEKKTIPKETQNGE